MAQCLCQDLGIDAVVQPGLSHPVAEGMEMMGAASVLYPRLYAADMILANVIVLSLGFLASLSPAWRASRYEPVEAITKVG